MADELINILDKNGKKTKLIQSKKYSHRIGLWHAVTNVWVYNSKGEILLQKRSKLKGVWPNKLGVSAGGHVSVGEKIEQAAVRETFEEIGIKTTIKQLEKIAVKKIIVTKGEVGDKKYRDRREFTHVFLLKYDKNISNLKIQECEVSQIKFIPIKKIESELNDKVKCEKYAHTKEYYLEIIRIIKKKLKQ
jgi:isopentenyldiphosphate isomerase